MAGELPGLLPGCDVPEPDHVILTARGEARPVGTPRHREHSAGMSDELPCLPLRRGIPEPDHAIFAARGERRPVWAERHAVHRTRVPAERCRPGNPNRHHYPLKPGLLAVGTANSMSELYGDDRTDASRHLKRHETVRSRARPHEAAVGERERRLRSGWGKAGAAGAVCAAPASADVGGVTCAIRLGNAVLNVSCGRLT